MTGHSTDREQRRITDEEAFLEERFDELFPICRSITGPGLRESLDRLSEWIPLEIEGVSSGTEVFDWTVPQEWRIDEAKLVGPDGEVYADFDETNLAVLNYSKPIDRRLSLDELRPHLYSLPDLPEATPYVTSYYERNWGFCLPHETVESLPEGEYHAYVDSEFVDGELNYGHAVLPGESDQEVLLSSYLCHPSLANNELSGPLVMALLYDRLAAWDERRFSYRFVLCPETIGSISYLSRYGDHLTDALRGGLVLTCLGGPEPRLRYKKSRRETALLDSTVEHLDEYGDASFEIHPFDPSSGSDERQYCSPGFDLPVGQMARTVYREYEGYHNSLDTKAFMGIDPLVESADRIERVLRTFEVAGYYENQYPYGEPMLGKRDLYPDVSSYGEWADSTSEFVGQELSILNYSDGTHSMLEIAERNDRSVRELVPVIELLRKKGVLERLPETEPPSTAEYGSPTDE
ncbi:DUF4910 domain-containing protein [Halosolutus amylolyticus]|uniref:DUF4910 domain-containing protein n=1 Tax=Halosolutus amylolyticus TaxID=2932267 RepID=A0ABD5PNP0_9EURY|nr:DUF4910 domain-containing protein [Halosolutus amylolyticus]